MRLDQLLFLYGGFPIIDNDHFDTEMVSKIIFDMKRGKAADIYGLTVEFCSIVTLCCLCYYLNSFC